MSTRQKIREKLHLITLSHKRTYQILYSFFIIRVVLSFLCWLGYFIEAIIIVWLLDIIDGQVLTLSGYPTDKRYKRYDWLADFLAFANITVYAATIWPDWSLFLIVMLVWRILIGVLRQKDKRVVLLNSPFMKLVTLRAFISVLRPDFVIGPGIVVAVFLINIPIEYFIHLWE